MKKVKLEIGVKMSDNMNWVAIDEDGKMWAFENEPLPSYHEYDKEETGRGVWVAPGDFEFIMQIDKPANWESTLRKI